MFAFLFLLYKTIIRVYILCKREYVCICVYGWEKGALNTRLWEWILCRKNNKTLEKVVNVLLFKYSPAKKTVNVDFFLVYVYFGNVERVYICTTKKDSFPLYTLYLVYVVNVYMFSIGFLLPSMLHINRGVY